MIQKRGFHSDSWKFLQAFIRTRLLLPASVGASLRRLLFIMNREMFIPTGRWKRIKTGNCVGAQ